VGKLDFAELGTVNKMATAVNKFASSLLPLAEN